MTKVTRAFSLLVSCIPVQCWTVAVEHSFFLEKENSFHIFSAVSWRQLAVTRPSCHCPAESNLSAKTWPDLHSPAVLSTSRALLVRFISLTEMFVLTGNSWVWSWRKGFTRTNHFRVWRLYWEGYNLLYKLLLYDPHLLLGTEAAENNYQAVILWWI